MIEVLHGDMLVELPKMAAETFDCCVCDPPYHLTSIVKRFGSTSLNDQTKTSTRSRERSDGYGRAAAGFMGKQWDGGDIAARVETWQAVSRVLKPGAWLLAFGGTRTFHRMACAIEDAGFEIRDTLCWLYGSGFPKGLNVVNNCIKMALWHYPDHVRFAAQSSSSIRLRSNETRGHIAAALVQILPEGVPGLLTEIGGEVALHVPMATWPSGWMGDIGLNMTWSWNNKLDDALNGMNKCITATVSEVTTTSKIYNWLIGLHTSQTITRCDVILQNGSPWPAITVNSSLKGESTNKSDILVASVLGDATWNPVARFTGFNVALKPAWEPIIMARKPLSEKTVAANVLKWGTGAINVDACRIGTDVTITRRNGDSGGLTAFGRDLRSFERENPPGRWPANVAHDGSEEVIAGFPQYGDSGSAARFFYTSKADADDRLKSLHPTVKPVDLMRWLVRMVTPPGGTILDPFAGSGTTGMAAMAEGFNAVLIEREEEYYKDILRRIGHVSGDDTPLFAEVR